MPIYSTSDLYSGAPWFGGTPVADLLEYLGDDRNFSDPTETSILALRRNLIAAISSSDRAPAVDVIEKVYASVADLGDPSVQDFAARLAISGIEMGSRALIQAAVRAIATLFPPPSAPRAIELRLGLTTLGSWNDEFDAGADTRFRALAIRIGRSLLAESGFERPYVEETVPTLLDPLLSIAKAGANPNDPPMAAVFDAQGGLSAILDSLREKDPFAKQVLQVPSTTSCHQLFAAVAEGRLQDPLTVWQLAGLVAAHFTPEDAWRPAACAMQLLNGRVYHAAAIAAAAGWLCRFSAPLTSRLASTGFDLVTEIRQVRGVVESSGLAILSTLRKSDDADWDSLGSVKIRDDGVAPTLDILMAPTFFDSSVRADFEAWLATLDDSLRTPVSETVARYTGSPWAIRCALAGDWIIASLSSFGTDPSKALLAAARLHLYATASGVPRAEGIARVLAAQTFTEDDSTWEAELWFAALAWISLAAQPALHGNPLKSLLKVYQSVKRLVRAGQWIIPASGQATALDTIWAIPREASGSPSETTTRPLRLGSEETGVIVFQSIGHSGKSVSDIQKQFGSLVGKRLRLVKTRPLPAVRQRLVSRAPHLGDVIDSILKEFGVSCYVHSRPLLLVGPPGCGKSDLATQIASAFEVPYLIFPCGGVADAAFAGTSRHWASARPAVPISFIAESQTANCQIILDEIEKSTTDSHNGSLQSAVMGMMEPSTAKEFWDPYLEAPVNIASVGWILTANELSPLHRALVDRCKILRCPQPEAKHLGYLLPEIQKAIITDRGLDERWVPPLPDGIYDLVARFWRGGSLRRLRRVVETIIDRADHALPN